MGGGWVAKAPACPTMFVMPTPRMFWPSGRMLFRRRSRRWVMVSAVVIAVGAAALIGLSALGFGPAS